MVTAFRENRQRLPDAAERTLGLWVDRIGLHPDGVAWFHAPRILGLHALCAVNRGTGRLRRADGTSVPLHTGDAWWVPPEQPLNYGPEPGTRWTHTALVFAGPLADALAGQGLRPAGLVARRMGPAVEAAWRLLTPLAGRPGMAAATARLAAMTAACARCGPGMAIEDPRLAAAADLLARHGSGPLDSAALARRTGLGPSQLRRLFAAQHGCSPSTWLTRLRMERARDLLSTTALPVAMIAETAGFADPFWFSRLFRREHGSSPADWRRQRRSA